MASTEFISVTFPNASNELHPIPGAGVDPEFLVRYSRSLDDYGYNYTLIPYGSSGFDPFTLGATVAAVTKNIKIIIALRPNTLPPTVAAKALATLDQLSKGRAIVHFIAGGSDAEQAKEGDFLNKEQRYGRLEEYIKILRRAWESRAPFDWDGTYFKFKQFHSDVVPVNGTIPVSVGGSSSEAYRIGGSLADIFGLWGEPLKETKEQIDRIYSEAEKAGRKDRPRIWVTFRPIVGETEELAWAKAHKTLDALTQNTSNGVGKSPPNAPAPQNVGSQRLLDIAKRGEVQDRALWYPTVTATNARGASTALVGSYKTVVDSILDYVELGAELISIRGYDNFNDAVDGATDEEKEECALCATAAPASSACQSVVESSFIAHRRPSPPTFAASTTAGPEGLVNRQQRNQTIGRPVNWTHCFRLGKVQTAGRTRALQPAGASGVPDPDEQQQQQQQQQQHQQHQHQHQTSTSTSASASSTRVSASACLANVDRAPAGHSTETHTDATSSCLPRSRNRPSEHKTCDGLAIAVAITADSAASTYSTPSLDTASRAPSLLASIASIASFDSPVYP
ncbi:hypothetical protein MBLNU459_g6212t1 [Dothideomycetes sp. NU459]